MLVPDVPEVASPRERILAAARRIFLDGPPEQATMDAVAQEAGMSKKTIYREFKSQLELLGALLAESAAEFGEIQNLKPGEDIELELYGLVYRICSFITAPRSMALFRLLISEVRRYPELMKQAKPRGLPVLAIAGWLNSPVVKARYQIDDPEDAAAMLMGMVMQDSVFKLLLSDTAGAVPPHLIEERARRAVTIFLRGVRRDPL